MTYMTTFEVADLLRTSPATVRYWQHMGNGPASFKVGRRRLYARADVEAFIARARETAPSTTPDLPRMT
jgi:excisionase family DNA binding protein